LERRLKEALESRRRIETQIMGQQRETALEKNDAYRKTLTDQINKLNIYDDPPDHFPQEPGIKELMHTQNILKNGTAEEKMEVLNRMDREGVQRDALRKRYQEKLQSPVYRQEVISEFKSRKMRFNLLTIILIFSVIGSIFLVRHIHMSNDIFLKITCFLFAGIFVATYIYIGHTLWRCPACGYKLDFTRKSTSCNGRIKLNRSNVKSCPQCGAPFC